MLPCAIEGDHDIARIELTAVERDAQSVLR